MSSRPEDLHLERFRQTGDPAAVARVFDLTAPKLLQVAQHLTADVHQAEDLLQATFLSAIESAASYRSEGPVLSWLLGILANHARNLRRQARRPTDRSRLALGTATDPAVAAGEREFSTACRKAIDGMPEHYAQVLELNLQHGLNAKEIARVLRRPPGTVRTQIVRGMELLRNALPTSFAVGAAVVATSGRGLAAVRQVVVEHAGSLIPAGVATGGAGTVGAVGAVGAAGTAGAAGGILLMKKGVFAAIALILVVMTMYVAWDGWAADAGGSEAGAGTGTLRGGENRAKAASPDQAVAVRQRSSRETLQAAGRATGSLRLRCVWKEDGTPAPVAQEIRCYRHNEGRPGWSKVTRNSDRNGVLFVEALPVGEYMFTTRGAKVELTILPDQLVEGRLALPSALLEGDVVDSKKRPVGMALVKFQSGALRGDLRTLATTGPDGRFRVRVGDGGTLWAQKPGRQPSRVIEIQSPLSDSAKKGAQQLRLILPGPGHALSGIVEDPAGRPVAGARVAVTVDEGWTTITLPGGSHGTRQPPLLLTSDANGRFRTTEAPAGNRSVYARCKDYAVGTSKVEVTEDQTASVTVRLRRGATVRGVVRDRAGRPFAAAGIKATHLRGLAGMRRLGTFFTDSEAVSDARGRYRLVGVMAADMYLTAGALEHRTISRKATLEEGQELLWNPVLLPKGPLQGGVSIKGILVGPDGAKLERWTVVARCLTADLRTERETADTDADGRFEITGLRDTNYRLSVLLPGTNRVCAARVRVRPGAGEFTWMLPFAAGDCGSVMGRVLHATGQPPRRARLTMQQPYIVQTHHPKLQDDGGFRIDKVPPGLWLISVEVDGYGAINLGQRSVAPKSALDLGLIRLREKGRAVVYVKRQDGKATKGLVVRLLGDRGSAYTRSSFPIQDGGQRSTPVPPGQYTVHVTGDDIAPVKKSVLIQPGQDVRVDVVATVAPAVRVRFVRPDMPNARFRGAIMLHLADASGTEVLREILQVDAQGSYVWTMGLRPGAYQLQASTFTTRRRKGQVTLRVPREGARPVTAELRLELTR